MGKKLIYAGIRCQPFTEVNPFLLIIVSNFRQNIKRRVFDQRLRNGRKEVRCSDDHKTKNSRTLRPTPLQTLILRPRLQRLLLRAPVSTTPTPVASSDTKAKEGGGRISK